MKRRSVLGVCTLCALAISALAAQSASAQKAYTCGAGGTNEFSDALCTVSSPGGGFGYIPFTGVTTVGMGISSSATKLKSVQKGVTLEIQSTEISGPGAVENHEVGAETWMDGTVTIALKKATVTVPPGKGCKVAGSEIKTSILTVTSKGLTNQFKFSPFSAAHIATLTVEGCSLTALNGSYTIDGSVIGIAEGATIVFTHSGTTGLKTLTMNGQVLGVDTTIGLLGENGNGLALK